MVFNCTWFDEMAAADKPYRMLFYPLDNSIELIDERTGKVHLRRIRNEAIQKQNLFVGSQVAVYGRKYVIKEFADVSTKQNVNNVNLSERAFVLVKPDAYLHAGKIMSDISQVGLQINKVQMARFDSSMVGNFYSEHVQKPYYPQILTTMTADVVVGIEVVGNDVINKCHMLAGPTNP